MNVKSFIVGYNRNNQLSYHDLNISETNEIGCIPIYEDIIFCAVFVNGERVLCPKNELQEIVFSKFTQQERYLISSEFFDSSLIKSEDYRKQNSEFCFVPDAPEPPVFEPIPMLISESQIDVHSIQLTFNEINYRIYFRYAIDVYNTFNLVVTYLDNSEYTYFGACGEALASMDFSFESEKQPKFFRFERYNMYTKSYFFPTEK